MCTSRFFRVLRSAGEDVVVAQDVDGREHRLSLLAFEEPAPLAGTWVIAHAGYALASSPADQVQLALDELQRIGYQTEQLENHSKTVS
ncbi:MAG: hypothetical protein WB770_00585 [Acidimicrobiales bacterium]